MKAPRKINYDIDTNERLTREQMVERYPDAWVLLDEVETVDGHPDVASGVVKGVYDDDTIKSRQLEAWKAGKHYWRERTTERFPVFMGVFNAFDFRC